MWPRRIRTQIPYAQSRTGLDPRSVGATADAPGPENAWGAIVAPTLDPTRRPDVLNPDGSRSSLISSSDRLRDANGTPIGEMLYPQVTEDGREIGPDAGYDLAKDTGKHLGVYSSIPMADQAAIAMHNAGADQMESPSFQPTGWFRADQPGVRYPDQASRDAGAKPMFDNEDDRFRLRRPSLLDDEQPPVTNDNALPALYQRAAPTPAAPTTAPTAGAAAAGGGAGAMSWINTIAGALAARQQEQDAKRQARADLAAQYASTQGDFPMYGAQAVKKRRAIDNQMGGPGLGQLRRLGRGIGLNR